MISRRNFLTRSAAAATGASLIAAAPWKAFAATALDWTDPAAWPSGIVPGVSDIAVVTQPIQLSGTATVAGVVIESGGELAFDSAASVTLKSAGNIEVYGLLTVKPSSAVTHTITFTGVDESKFVGGGMDVLATDVGLWVRGSGQLDIAGSPKVAWNRTGDDVSWSSSDSLVVTPTASGDYTTFKSFTKGSAVPTVNGIWAAEVLNLTRNVVIEGEAGKRAHINIISDQPQFVSHALIRNMGPTQPKDDYTIGYVGRYPLHLHHCGEGSRGSVVDGVVVTDSGARAFVPHGSHGITMRNCIAYRIQDAAFWWDFPDDDDDTGANNTNDTVWDDCVAAAISPNDPIRGFTLHGFSIGAGSGNIARRCVAVGILGTKNSSGYHWPSKANAEENVWVFEDCLAHNNVRTGIYGWQNDSNDHVITRFDAYRCGFAGIIHGAYTNRYLYQDIRIHDCPRGLEVHAKGPEDDKPPALRFNNVVVTGSTVADVVTTKHNSDNEGVTEYTGGDITTVLVDNAANSGDQEATYTFIDTGLYPSGVTLGKVVAGTMVIGQNGDEQWQMDHTGLVTYLDADLSRSAGTDRYDTAATISREAFAPGVPVAYVATGLNFPDALAAGAAGGTLGGPVLLTDTTHVPTATKTELTRLKPKRIVILGGTSIIDKNTANALESYSANVDRIAGIDRYDTAAKISKEVFTTATKVVYVATGENFPDALAAGAAACLKGGPVLLTAFGSLPGATRTELARLKPDEIVVLGGTAAISSIVEGQLAAYAPVVRRLAGIDRYTTAAAISKDAFGTKVPVAYVSTGENFPDALAAAAAAGFRGGPVLLTRSSVLPTSTAAELARLKPAEIVVLGGTSIVSTDVAAQLSQYV